jgi:hypothetical protein
MWRGLLIIYNLKQSVNIIIFNSLSMLNGNIVVFFKLYVYTLQQQIEEPLEEFHPLRHNGEGLEPCSTDLQEPREISQCIYRREKESSHEDWKKVSTKNMNIKYVFQSFPQLSIETFFALIIVMKKSLWSHLRIADRGCRAKSKRMKGKFTRFSCCCDTRTVLRVTCTDF